MNYITNIIIDILINYVQLLGKIFIGTMIGSAIGGKIKLKRLSPYNGKTIASKDFVFSKLNSLDKETIDYEKKETLKPYVLKLSNYIGLDDLKIVSHNIKTATIKRKPLLYLQFIGGVYISEENRLLFASTSFIGHEFLHLASSIYDQKSEISLSGFEQQKKYAYIGKGINEGYTELLSSRLYNKKNKVAAYMNLVKIANMIEFFFDDPKDMAHLYFTCNLPGLITQLEKYASNKEVMQLIYDIDFTYTSSCYYSPVVLIKSVQIQLKLWKWFQAKCNDKEKLEQFEKLALRNKVVSLFIKGNRVSLVKAPITSTQKINISEPKEKPAALETKPKVANVFDILSEAEKEALEEMLQIENLTLPTETPDIAFQKSMLEEVKSMLEKPKRK